MTDGRRAPDAPAAALVAAADRLLARISHWTAQRWAQPIRTGAVSRGARVYALVQQLADIVAAAEGQPIRPVPRLDNDLALPDQLRVMIVDLTRSPMSADALWQAKALIDGTAQLL